MESQNKEFVRTRFLKYFTQEIIFHVSYKLKKADDERAVLLKKELIHSYEDNKEPMYANREKNQEYKPSILLQPSIYNLKDEKEDRRQIFHRKRLTPRINPRMNNAVRSQNLKSLSGFQRSQFEMSPNVAPQINDISPEYSNIPEGFFLGKIDNILKDPSVQNLECPGPGKNILVRRYNKINLTRLVLSQVEIKDIINRFANEAQIPVAGGILKAAAGNLTISAFDSEYAGSRFIITKINPFG